MHRLTAFTVGALAILSLQQAASAAVFNVALSPPASAALNLGTQIYPGDHALAMRGPNENPQNASTGSGDVINVFTYDDVTNVLTFDLGYGAAFGFSDLVSDWNGGVHIHGNGTNTALFPAVNANAGITHDLGSFHTSSGLRAGRITGSVTFTETHETWLKDNQLYINVHTIQFPGGEIRGQLVIVPEPASAALGVIVLPLLARRRRR